MDPFLLGRLAANLLQAETLVIESETDRAAALAGFEKAHCLSPEYQPMFTAQGLESFLERLSPRTFYEIEGRLHISLMAFSFEGALFLVGPYVKDPYNEQRIQAELTERYLPYSSVHRLRLYYSSLPLLLTDTAVRVLTGILQAMDPNASGFEVKIIRDRPEPPVRPEASDRDSDALEAVKMRYRFENRFLSAISTGDTADALRYFDRMTSVSVEFGQSISIYRDPQVSFAILRTLIRKAAEGGGLSVIEIDTITQRAVQQTSSALTLAEQHKHTRDLVRDLSDAVHETRLRTRDCSAETRAILEYLHYHYAECVRIDELTALTGRSRAYISNKFKADKGMSILSWIAMLRCRKARELLLNTGASISDIAAVVGYDDANYFVKVYKKEIGETPGETRGNR